MLADLFSEENILRVVAAAIVFGFGLGAALAYGKNWGWIFVAAALAYTWFEIFD